jgi:hypothetical protein
MITQDALEDEGATIWVGGNTLTLFKGQAEF